jgi:hypothetical protein
MPDPRHLPPDLDVHPKDVFTAVGVAITSWETLEHFLAELYSVFDGNPRNIGAMQRYGRESLTFQQRIQSLERAAEVYFRRMPHQDREGEFDIIICTTRELSRKRNQIAHGIVRPLSAGAMPMQVGDVFFAPIITYRVMPPWYAAEQLTKGENKPPVYGSKDIRELAKLFRKSAYKASRLVATLCGERQAP